MKVKRFTISLITASILPSLSIAQELFSIQDLSFIGATRFLDVVAGESRLGYANGTFTIDSKKESIFIVGHEQHQAIAEYKLNGFSKGATLQDLPLAEPILQEYVRVLDKATGGNPENLDKITGLELISGKLIVNAAQFYDADAGNRDTTLVITDPSDIKNSEIQGFSELDGGVHAAGWMTQIPQPLRDQFKADYIFGYASNLPINSRNSMGPSAFLVNSNHVVSAISGEMINTTPVLDYSIDYPLHEDHYNKTGENNLWTEISKAYIGFIVPGTKTYAVFGFSAGHNSGIGYKITQDTGFQCGGACSKVASDRYNYYWLWNVDDLIEVKNGNKMPYDLMPYEYGRIVLPFEGSDSQNGPHTLIGAHYSYDEQKLFLMLGFADNSQGQYEPLPVLLAYDLHPGKRPAAPKDLVVE